ncbi:MAG: DUF262 domain-containing protein [Eubacterium sp.]|nr:DUF262 domain-containing protein [Eubacterium sp.]MBQ6362488.1 DUF262 domain-containing protein [Lachnospiraceae bacterium]
MSMTVQKISDLVLIRKISVKDPSKGFTIRDLVEGYMKDSDDGTTTDSVFGYGGKLNIRPSYQRNSVYNEKKRNAVIETILDECPLNTIYWVDKEDGTYEVLDGQQRILSICKYLAGEFAVSADCFPTDLPQDFPNLQTNMTDIAERVLDYQLDIYVCKGSPSEKLRWFRRINTSGEPLNDQELRNSSYTGAWLSDAKARFSSENGRGVRLTDINPNNNKPEPLLNGSWNRQEYLETALEWAAKHEGFVDKKDGPTAIEQYMLKHRGDADASALWQYFSQVLEWVRSKFVSYNKALKGMDWGAIYEAFQKGDYNSNIIAKSAIEINDKIIELTNDDEVTAPIKGIYQYIIYGDGRYLSIRQFDEKVARAVYEQQHHHCVYCLQEGNQKEYAFKDMHADHIQPWSKGGKTVPENCQMLCRYHNETKGNRW